jgi:hypothetical protein
MKQKRSQQEGSVLALTTIAMFSLLLITALAIDISHFYVVKTELQNASDAASLAGVFELNGESAGITAAVDSAIDVLDDNKYHFQHKSINMGADPRQYVRFGVNLSDVNCTPDTADCGMTEAQASAAPANIRFVRVRIPPQFVAVSFARIMMGNQAIGAKAVAGQSVPSNLFCNVAPLSVVQCSDADPAECQLRFTGECPTPPADGCDPTREYCKGCTYIVRSAPAQGPSPGNYQILDLFEDLGVREALASAGTDCLKVGDCVETKPGVTAGQVRQGINTRFNEYAAGMTAAEFPPDTNIYEGVRTGNGNNSVATGMTHAQYIAKNPMVTPNNTPAANRRYMVVPIIEYNQFANGKTLVCIKSFAAFFLTMKVGGGNDGDIKFEYVGRAVAGAGGYDPSGGAASNVVVPVLYK